MKRLIRNGKVIVVCIAYAAVSACSMEAETDFEARPFERRQVLSSSYQESYARFMQEARRCWRPGNVPGSPQSYQLDAQIYSELGYGEVRYYSSGLIYTPVAIVKFERAGKGSVVSVKTGPIAGKAKIGQQAIDWASGAATCRVK